MTLVKKILVAHHDPRLKRRIVLSLADAGFDVRAFLTPDEAVEAARNEWFDLALVAEQLPDITGLQVFESLKQVQPTAPVALLSETPELALVVKCIRLGIADVIPLGEDLRPTVRRVRDLLNPGVLPDADESGVTPADLAEVEQTLARMDREPGVASSAAEAASAQAMREQLLQLTKERDELDARLQRTLHERNALESEVKALLIQNSDAAIQQAELTELRTQRERVAAAQDAIEAKARALSDQREEIERERSLLESERLELEEKLSVPMLPEWAASAAEVAAMRERVHKEEARQRDTAMKLQQEAAKIARERRRWHDDLDLLREQETNLKEYESRLRKVQTQLEADRVLWFSTTARPEAKSPFDDGALREAWQKLQRASELLESERAHVRNDRLYTQEKDTALKAREEQLATRESKVAEAEARMAARVAAAPAAAPAPSGPIRTLARAPLEMAKSVFGGSKKQ
ncbi:MAG: response regulator [Opitutaceae bacterium]|jgi:DNA-binding response OmpR family regulator|nr:response regulator [Opitutaceae bacterium]